MSTLSIRIPDSLHKVIKKFSQEDHISINQFISSAVAEKVTAFETEKYIQNRGQIGSTEKFLSVLNSVSNETPDSFDQI